MQDQSTHSSRPRHSRTGRAALAAAVAVCVLVPSLLFAMPHGRGDAARARGEWSIGSLVERLVGRLGDRLDLDNAQRERIAAIVEEHREVLREEVETLLAARRDLFATIHGESFDETAIRQAAAEVAAAQADLAVERGRLVEEIRGELTAEQLERVEHMLDAMMGFAEAFLGV